MIYIHSLGRATRYFPERTALAANGKRSTFRELDARVGRVAGALTRHGFKAWDRLALLLPNEAEYIELVYACAWLGVIAVPLNTRLSAVEIDRVLTDANPRGLIRHSSLPRPTAEVSWRVVLDQEPLDVRDNSLPDPIYDPDAISYLTSASCAAIWQTEIASRPTPSPAIPRFGPDRPQRRGCLPGKKR